MNLRAPFPYFGGKRDVAAEIWKRLGSPRQYIEPFCGSAAVLLAAPRPASLEVVGDLNGFIANFWRATVSQPDKVAKWADYPVSHIDLSARHVWLMDRREYLAANLLDAEWPGEAQAAGWWLWGQCCWIGSGWCEWDRAAKIPHVSDAGRGIQARGQIPHVSDAGMGVQALGKIPHVSDGPELWTSSGRTALAWLRLLADRMERVRIVHGEWNRCLNNHYGGSDTAIFFDPPYDNHEDLYGSAPVATAVAEWAGAHADLRIAIAGHRGDYELSGWDVFEWKRKRLTYGGNDTTDAEALWFSPACIKPSAERSLFDLFSVVTDDSVLAD